MKTKKTLIVSIIIALTLIVLVIVLLVKNRQKKGVLSTESVLQSVKSSVSSSVTGGYVKESFPLKKGMYGDNISIMQWTLMFMGYNLGNGGQDGKFGDKTLAAVRSYFNNPSKTQVTYNEWLTFKGIYDSDPLLKK